MREINPLHTAVEEMNAWWRICGKVLEQGVWVTYPRPILRKGMHASYTRSYMFMLHIPCIHIRIQWNLDAIKIHFWTIISILGPVSIFRAFASILKHARIWLSLVPFCLLNWKQFQSKAYLITTLYGGWVPWPLTSWAIKICVLFIYNQFIYIGMQAFSGNSRCPPNHVSRKGKFSLLGCLSKNYFWLSRLNGTNRRNWSRREGTNPLTLLCHLTPTKCKV